MKEYKFVCVEALPSKDGKHVKHLVSDKGHFIGVKRRPREQMPDRVKLEHWRKDQAPILSMIERFEPAPQVRRLTDTLAKAIKKGMLKFVPDPKSKKRPKIVRASDFTTAMKAFGIDPNPPAKSDKADGKKAKPSKTSDAGSKG